jgi:hypothetical protein
VDVDLGDPRRKWRRALLRGAFHRCLLERAAEERLHHIAHHDVLTGLFNRFSLKVISIEALAAAGGMARGWRCSLSTSTVSR